MVPWDTDKALASPATLMPGVSPQQGGDPLLSFKRDHILPPDIKILLDATCCKLLRYCELLMKGYHKLQRMSIYLLGMKIVPISGVII
jgi:hypothetical protein